MTAKQYLSQIRYKTEKIAEQKEYIQRLRDSLGIAGIRYDLDKVQTSHSNDKVAEVICKIVDEEERLKQMQESLISFKIQVIDMIKELEKENHRKILNIVYVDMKTLKECSRTIKFSYDYVRELHLEALKAFEEKFPQHTS